VGIWLVELKIGPRLYGQANASGTANNGVVFSMPVPVVPGDASHDGIVIGQDIALMSGIKFLYHSVRVSVRESPLCCWSGEVA
jgi:hypothetical protein